MVLRICYRRGRSSLLTLLITCCVCVMVFTSLEITFYSPCTMQPEYDNISTGALERDYYFSPLQQHSMKAFGKGAHHVLILSYQRSGSSFLGQLFNQNRKVRFLYEPVDSVYVSLYGTPEGWNVPTDITNSANGSVRNLPDYEIEAVGSTLHDLFTCNMQNLRTETLTHRFWKQFASFQYSSNEFARCMESRRASLRICRGHLGDRCGRRFGDARYMDKCHDLMKESFKRWNGSDTNIEIQKKWDAAQQNKSANPSDITKHETYVLKDAPRPPKQKISVNQNDVINQRRLLTVHHRQPVRLVQMNKKAFLEMSFDSDMVAFMRYHSCTAKARQTISRCVQKWAEQCTQSEAKVIKTVRATMESAEYLLDTIPNLRVVHLIRDPRAVVLSRSRFDGSASSIYAGKPMDMVKEARLFCRQVVNDIEIRQRLQQSYPGQIMEVVYDDFVLHPLEYTELLYKFSNITLPEKTIKWVKKQTLDNKSQKKNATFIANKWQDKLSFRITKEIKKECQTFFDYVKYDWPE